MHSEHVHKSEEFFKRKLEEFDNQTKSLKKLVSVSSNALLASYKVSYRIAKCKKPHNIGETLVLPAAIDMVEAMFGESYAKQLQQIPLADNTVARRIDDISEDLCDQLVSRLQNNIEWINCVGLCTDGAQSMSGNKSGLQALVKNRAPEIIWTHCMLHRSALVSKNMSPELNDIFAQITKVINYIKHSPLRAKLFAKLCEDMDSKYTSLLYYYLAANLQLEIIDLKYDSDMKNKFTMVGLDTFYKYLLPKYPNLTALAAKILSMFANMDSPYFKRMNKKMGVHRSKYDFEEGNDV
ncbi:SCAN domain-containing protein 3-like [Octopus sinensis]|uniref:SCAN domain-containing protein 3-like n=1 Tax=Octopus sinensis TaxID=2607531 RepID=A0A6P7U7R4_9MOLL|nr:SCAN domain-containing protein 3-like [Octopus sinensis]